MPKLSGNDGSVSIILPNKENTLERYWITDKDGKLLECFHIAVYNKEVEIYFPKANGNPGIRIYEEETILKRINKGEVFV